MIVKHIFAAVSRCIVNGEYLYLRLLVRALHAF